MTMPEVIDFIDRYASRVGAPVRTGTTVTDVRRVEGGYRVTTDDGVWEALTVMLAGGAFNLPHVPESPATCPARWS
jgi:putative flavoprotein involved in K+ transport